jgi:hypothetical protein
MFQNVTLPNNFVLPVNFGSQATNMSNLFTESVLNTDIDWSNTDFKDKTGVTKTDMFKNTNWGGHYFLVKNTESVTFLITDSGISDNTRIKVKDINPVLKTETANPTNFLDVPNLNRSQITKISFQNTLPTCSSPTDVSFDGKGGVMACVANSTEIVVGGPAGVIANADSSYLFSKLSVSGGVEINLTNLNTVNITNMEHMFKGSSLKAVQALSSDFGKTAVDMSHMFDSATLLANVVLPDGFGSVATNMANMFDGATLSSNFSLPGGFGSQATNMYAMFDSASLPASLALPAGFGSVAQSMRYMFEGASLPITSFTLPAGFGSTATNMSSMFTDTTLLAGFELPDGFGSKATDTTWMFENANLPANFVLPTGFGSVVIDMSDMFQYAVLNGDIDWSGTDLTASTATKGNLFNIITWNGHFILAQNQTSVDWLIDGTGAGATNVKVKGS